MQSIDKIDTREHLAKLMGKKEVAQDAFEFTFELERTMEYKPGQYVWIELPHVHNPDTLGNRRAFSIVSTPDKMPMLTILFRSTPSGFNTELRNLKLGDELRLIGPFGSSFCFPADDQLPLVLIAGGVGLAPFLCLVRHALNSGSERPITLVVLNNSAESASYAEELNAYNKSTKTITTVNLTRKFEFKDIESSPDLAHALVYVAGPQAFVDYTYDVLKTNSIFRHQLRFEAFYPEPESKHAFASIFTEGKLRISPTETTEIRRRAELIYSLVNTSATHTIVTDINGVIVFANQGSQNITGYSLTEMLGQTPRLWGGMMSKEYYEKLWTTMRDGVAYTGEIINRRKNSEIYIATAHFSPIKNQEGDIVGYIGSEEDITSVRKAQQRAEENERRFVELTQKINEGYWITDFVSEEKVVYVSPAFEEIFGLKSEDLYNDPHIWLERVLLEDKQKITDILKLFLEKKSDFDQTFQVMKPDGRVLFVRMQGERVLDDKGNLVRVVGVVQDVTKEKTIDQEKTDFVSFASHQFKTPVTAIRWNLESFLAGKYGEITGKQKEILEGMHTMNLRIDELINNMLNISRIEQGVFIIEPTPTDFEKVCDEVLMEAEPYIAKKEHTIKKEFEENLPHVLADSKLLRIVFQNYISNAIKYTPEKGRIIVSLKTREGEIVFCVSNNGEEIPEVEQSKIFQKMFRATNASKQDPAGTGLGLYIVKDIVENGGGRVWFYSKSGETAFYAAFPLAGMVAKVGNKSLV